jgi:hypothetical protein
MQGRKPEPTRFYARPEDRSFAACKEFILAMAAALGGENDLSDDELQEAWQEFWATADQRCN